MKRISKFAAWLKPEDRLHTTVVNYIKYRYPGALIHHSPNEGKRGPYQRYLIKCLGVSPGFPDLLMFYKGKVLAMELKIGKNRPSVNQRKWLADLAAYMPVGVIYSLDDAIVFLEKNL